jgi:hypothetical protein
MGISLQRILIEHRIEVGGLDVEIRMNMRNSTYSTRMHPVSQRVPFAPGTGSGCAYRFRLEVWKGLRHSEGATVSEG